MRLIDADILKEEMDMAWRPDMAVSEIWNVIDDAPTVNDWISVKDRPPKKNGWYLVSLVNTRTGHRWEVPVPADYSHGKWDYSYLVVEDDATLILNNTVTHWMPRPKPPKEENHETD